MELAKAASSFHADILVSHQGRMQSRLNVMLSGSEREHAKVEQQLQLSSFSWCGCPGIIT